jgi:hypothetical protein
MIRDLQTILKDWEYEPGKISVRRIHGEDGRDRIQTRVDLGVLQCHIDGHPDDARPHGYESLLEYHESRLADFVERTGDDDGFRLSATTCRELRHEGYLYYQRYLSLFVIEDFERVARDTARNLRLMDFLTRYAADEADQMSLEPQRPYLVMMYNRSRALIALERGESERALRIVDGAICRVTNLLETLDIEDPETQSEITLLEDLRRRIVAALPEDCPTKLEIELNRAVEAEEFERAAEISRQLGCLDRPRQALPQVSE